MPNESRRWVSLGLATEVQASAGLLTLTAVPAEIGWPLLCQRQAASPCVRWRREDWWGFLWLILVVVLLVSQMWGYVTAPSATASPERPG